MTVRQLVAASTKAWRHLKGQTTEELAAAAGIPEQTVIDIEEEDISADADTLTAIATGLGITDEQLFDTPSLLPDGVSAAISTAAADIKAQFAIVVAASARTELTFDDETGDFMICVGPLGDIVEAGRWNLASPPIQPPDGPA